MSLTPRLDALQNVNNLIINGNMDYWQRGITLNISNTRSFLADRFSTYKTNSYTGTSTCTQVADVPTVAESGFSSTYSIKVTNGTGLVSPGASDSYYLNQNIEGYDYASIHSKNVRLSFWVKSSLTGTYAVALNNTVGTRSYIATYTVNSANTWEKKNINITLDNTGTWAFDNTTGLWLIWNLSGGSTWQAPSANAWVNGNYTSHSSVLNWAGTTGATFQLAQVMLCDATYLPADADIPFKRAGKTIGDELRLCQRYYQTINIAQYRPLGLFRGTGSTTQSDIKTLPVEMRATPTSTALASQTMYYWTAFGVNGTSGTANLSIAGNSSSTISFACNLVSANNATYIFANYSTTAIMELTAEL